MLNSVDNRLTAEERKKQLVKIGLMMLRDQPIHELSIDAIAGQAGISRSLLFHYFPSKRDYYVAVISAAGRRLLRVTKPDDELAPDAALREMLVQFVAFISRRRTAYISFVRGAAGGDDYAVEVYDDTRIGLCRRILGFLGTPEVADNRGSAEYLRIHAWLGYTEDLAIEWSGLAEDARPMTADELIDHAIDALHTLRKL
ncbi:TetR/AcrR family transcriptional regulator [Kribbella sandramycini]|uniref:AcrR family transcriptional regulator n=1 Tax=Kribbella sandramycini TaxID=60450 RepID=A0A7Y4KZZ6_9ACTN|nr:TetR/AcrR family transcriptional regulator [Kribbella sandramycini]MBB6565521.1 AcrR family transcriptional regulator [Kribbella sandramycini]NOL41788.1 TetR/AcrR family transcriptional regulator [Kribbella sandramycini]